MLEKEVTIMTVHLYMSLVPEALIASMLSPEEFGVYYAVGTKKKARGRAIFCEIDPEFRDEFFRIDDGIKRCVPHEDGALKSSIYISVYRVLEHIDLDAIMKMYLVTQDGRTLGLEPAEAYPDDPDDLHLYQEIAPVHPLVVSTLNPVQLYELIVKHPTTLLALPAICFAKLRLGELAKDPAFGVVGDLPYSNIDHLRECLVELRTKAGHTKMVDRIHPATIPYRTIKRGIFMGNQEKLVCFPMPSQEELRTNNYSWWRSANM